MTETHAESRLRQLAYEGYNRLREDGTLTFTTDEEYRKRIEYELSVFKEVTESVPVAYGSWADFLLVTADYANYARSHGVYVGPGRGSAAASLVCLCIGITTNIDPIRFRLIFERFLNPSRVSAPDIDLDFSDQSVVFDYLAEKYGENRVVRISAPQYMKAKGALKKAAEVLGIGFVEANQLTAEYERAEKQLDFKHRYKKDVDPAQLDEALEHSEVLADWSVRYPKLFPIARRFIGMLQNHSTHPAGALVLRRPAGAVIPLARVGSGKSAAIRTAWECKSLERLGFLKLDVLAVKNLNIIVETAEQVADNYGIVIRPEDIPLEDEQAASVFARGDMVGIFQLGDNDVAYEMAKSLPVETLDDVALINAAIRPGVDWRHIISNKQFPEQVHYPVEHLRVILDDSYGVFAYQEQIMFACRDLAGFTMSEADTVRKIVATTSNEALRYNIETYHDQFVAGCVQKGIDPTAASQVWASIRALATYCFNKAHALAYGLVAWDEAYLKARWPAEYLTSCLNNEVRKGDQDNYEKFIADAKAHGITVVPPDVNRSHQLCRVEDGKIILGLGMVKHVGKSGKRIASRAPYASYIDFAKRSGCVPKDVARKLEEGLFGETQIVPSGTLNEMTDSLIKAGAFDSIHPRADILGSCHPHTEMSTALVATWEQDAVGFFVTTNPLGDLSSWMRGWIMQNEDPRKRGPGGGLVTATATSKKGHGFLTVRTLRATMDLVCWADEWALARHQIRQGMVIKGSLYKTRRGNFSISGMQELGSSRATSVV